MELSEATLAPSSVHGGAVIRVARTLSEVAALRERWTAWQGHRDSDIDFFSMIVESYPEVLRPHVVTLYCDGKPEAILAGRLEQKRLAFKVGYFTLFRPMTRCLTFVYDAVHGNASPENIEFMLRDVMKSLKQGEADIAQMEFVPLDSLLYRLSLEVPGILSRDTHPAPQGHQSMSLPDSLDEVYRRMSGPRRMKTRKWIKKLQDHPAGEPKITCYRTESDLGRLFCEAEEIAQKTYQRGLGAGFSDSPVVRKRLAFAAEKGWLRAYMLYLGERPCAFWIGILYGETFHAEYMGYDPEFREAAPGRVLIIKVIERLCTGADGDKVRELDFGLGTAEYKEALCTRTWLEAVVNIFAPTPKGLWIKSMWTLTRLADQVARKVLASTNLLPRIRRLWRDRLAKPGDTSPAQSTFS